jgi:hypothetical protein
MHLSLLTIPNISYPLSSYFYFFSNRRMRALIVLVVVFATLFGASAAFSAAENPFCVVTTATNQTYNLNPIASAVYNTTLVAAVTGVVNAEVRFGWCATVNSSVCNVTDWSMAVETEGSCVTGFQVFIGPASIQNNAVTFQLWGSTDGVVGTVVVACDPNGAPGVAKPSGDIINEPIYDYAFSFTSVHACAV